MTEAQKYFGFEKLEDLSTPQSGTFELKVNQWWLVNGDGDLAFYRRFDTSPRYITPMSNPNKNIAFIIAKKYPDLMVKQIPLVYIPHSCEDYH